MAEPERAADIIPRIGILDACLRAKILQQALANRWTETLTLISAPLPLKLNW